MLYEVITLLVLMQKMWQHKLFPWRAGNKVVLYRDGDAFFPAILQAIVLAREFVLLEMYLVESGTENDR